MQHIKGIAGFVGGIIVFVLVTGLLWGTVLGAAYLTKDSGYVARCDPWADYPCDDYHEPERGLDLRDARP